MGQGTPKNPETPETPKEREITVVFMPKSPKFVMEPLEPTGEEATIMIDTRHDLVTNADAGYAVFANLMNTRNLVSQDGEKPKVISVVRPDDAGEFTLGLNMEVFKRLSHAARKELLKEQMLRIPYGHFSSRTKSLIQKYGHEIVNRASQIVLSQLVNTAILAEEGIVLPVPEMFDYPRDLTLEEYADRLAEDGNGSMPVPIRLTITKSDGKDAKIGVKVDDPELQKLLDDLTDENGLTRLDDMSASIEGEGPAMDSATKNFLQSADSALKASNSDLKSQGFMRGEAEEFIKSLDRRPRLRLNSHVRRMNVMYANPDQRISCPKRLSRRSPITPLGDGRFTKFYWGEKAGERPLILVWVDTSGSMSAKELRVVRPELVGLLNMNYLVLVGHIDAGIAKEPIPFTRHGDFDHFAGRGGTDFRPAFEYMATMRQQPSYVIYVTDGYGTAPDEEFYIPTLWVLTDSGMAEESFRTSVCSWGERFVLDTADED